MGKQKERELAQRAVALGESGEASGVPELLSLSAHRSAYVRRLAVLALGKLAAVVEPTSVVPTLTQQLTDNHPQVRQYAIKALFAYGNDARSALSGLQDIAESPLEKEYNRRDATKAIAYRYDERLQIIDGCAIRPDFYLPEFDLYIEYWGMDTIDYKIGMLKKQKLCQQQGKRLLSLSFREKPQLAEELARKLSRYIRLDPSPNDDEA